MLAQWFWVTTNAATRDLIVIGGSAGAIEALQPILRALPEDLPASVQVVVHQSQSAPGMRGSSGNVPRSA